MSESDKKFGALLKSERERQNIKIDDIADKLKIAKSSLEAIEEGNPSSLPSELYFSLFSKTYSEALGIDYSRTMEAIKDEFNGASEVKENQGAKPEAPENAEDSTSDSSKELIKKASYFGGAIVGLFIIFLLLNQFVFNSSDTNSNNENMIEENDASQTKNELESAYTNYNWESTSFKKPSKIRLTLIPREESWSTVLADGDTVIYRTLRVGRTYTAEADYRLLVSVGIPSAVRVLLNDKEVNLRNPESRRISRVLIDQITLESYLNPSKQAVDSPPPKSTNETVSADPNQAAGTIVNDTTITSSLQTDEG